MLGTVLVPLDGSKFAEAALPVAARLVRGAQGRLHIFVAHQPVVPVVGMWEMVGPPDQLNEEQRRRESAYLAETAAALGQVGDGPVRTHHADGRAGEAICEEAGRVGADLIVMSTHGRGALGRMWLGSVADYVIRHTSVPVLLVHPPKAGEPGPELAIRGILAPVDLSAESEAVLESVLTFTRLTQAHVTLFHVVQPFFGVAEPTLPYPAPVDPAIIERMRDDAGDRLERLAERYRHAGMGISTRVVVGPSAAGGVLDALEEPGFDMVAMTTHGARGVRRFLLGGVTDKVVRAARKPVLVFRPPGLAH